MGYRSRVLLGFVLCLASEISGTAFAGTAELCAPSESSDCVRFVSCVNNSLNVSYRNLNAVSGCPHSQGVYFETAQAQQHYPGALSEAELRDLYARRIFPAVREAVRRFGMSVNSTSCNIAAGYTVSALRELGVTGVE